MSTSTSTSALPAEAVRLTGTFDADRVLMELDEILGLDWARQKTRHRDGSVTETELNWRVLPLRSPGGAADRTDPGGPGAHDFAATSWLDRLPYLAEILDGIPAPLHAVRLMALGPGVTSNEHCDSKYSVRRGFVRLHIPLVTNPAAQLVLDGVEHCWQPGEFWFGEFCRPHLVRNEGTETRIHTVIDALLTSDLVELFPPQWRRALRGDDVLMNRSSPNPPPHVVPDARVQLPPGFLDFGTDSVDLSGSPVWTHRVQDGDTVKICTGDRTFALVHIDGGEFRFAGWTELRTIRFTHDGSAVLRVRDGSSTLTVRVPVELESEG